LLLQDPGYVAISIRGYLIEMSVPVLVGLIVLLLISVWLVMKVFRAPRKLGEAASRYRSGRAGQRLTRGMIEVAEGNFAKGEKLLARSANVSDAPLLNYLQAARAAHLLGHGDRRDGWLRQAYEHTPEATNAVLLTQAELQLDQKQYESALATLRQIEENSPNHGHALNLLGRLYYRLEDWDHLAEVMPKIRKHGRVDGKTLRKWSVRVRCERFNKAADAETIAQARKELPKDVKNDIAVLEAYFMALMRTGMHDKAEKDLATELRRDWRAPLVRLYGMTESSDGTRQLKKAETWLRTHANDVELLLASARLCLRNELWGKARSYLETVIAIRPTPEAFQEYGRLLNHLGENDAAATAFQDGLSMVAGPTVPAIPHLEAPDTSKYDSGDAD
jgi:HemY protein